MLLGLARGSGGRSLSGMRRAFEVYRRPLLDLTRADTETACLTEGIEFWTDPHNSDERFTRVRVRTKVLPLLEDGARARGGGHARAHGGPAAGRHRVPRRGGGLLRSSRRWTTAGRRLAVSAPALEQLPDAIRSRVLRLAAVRGRRPPGRAVPHPRARDRPAGHRLARPEVGRAPRPRPRRSAARDLLDLRAAIPDSPRRSTPRLWPRTRARTSRTIREFRTVRRGRRRAGGGWSRGRGRCRRGCR